MKRKTGERGEKERKKERKERKKERKKEKKTCGKQNYKIWIL